MKMSIMVSVLYDLEVEVGNETKTFHLNLYVSE